MARLMSTAALKYDPLAEWQEAVRKHGAQPIIEHGKTGMLLVLVPGGKFLAGDAKFSVELTAFYMGLQAVTNVQYGVFVKATKHRAPDNQVWEEGGKAEHPVTDVGWEDAAAYCEWAGLRLPGEMEWEKAARGEDGRKYPWGEKWDEKKCRNSTNRGSETTAGVWGYAEGVSPSGVYQMSGNVLEWCEDWYEKEAYERYQRGDLKPPGSGIIRVVRGGSWLYGDPDFFSASYRYGYVPVIRGHYGGFRCVWVLGDSP